MPEPDLSDPRGVGRFYDRFRGPGPSSAALGHDESHVGQECLLTTDEILAFARRAGISADTTVLDIGSGTAGPACYLARQLGCRVVGVDLSAVGHARGEARVREAGVGHLVQLHHGDIQAMALPPATFDVVIGLDAWCHIPGRDALLRRCASLLKTGGRVAFIDHVELRPIPDEQRQRLCAAWRFAGLETPRSYLDAIAAAGLRVLYQEQTAVYAARFYVRLLQAYVDKRADFEAARGPERYQEGLERLQMTTQLAVEGRLGQLACVATA
jgi:cyclopropane fatty-acyl-phospholipid synthase-like methyltransferase